jgi:hypothetical protein
VPFRIWTSADYGRTDCKITFLVRTPFGTQLQYALDLLENRGTDYSSIESGRERALPCGEYKYRLHLDKHTWVRFEGTVNVVDGEDVLYELVTKDPQESADFRPTFLTVHVDDRQVLSEPYITLVNTFGEPRKRSTSVDRAGDLELPNVERGGYILTLLDRSGARNAHPITVEGAYQRVVIDGRLNTLNPAR